MKAMKKLYNLLRAVILLVVMAWVYILAHDDKSRFSRSCRSWLLKKEPRSVRRARILLGGFGVFCLGFGLFLLVISITVLVFQKTWSEIWSGLTVMPHDRIWFLQGWVLNSVLCAVLGLVITGSGLVYVLNAKKPLKPPQQEHDENAD